MSNYYFNCKAVTLHPEGMYLIGNIVFDMIDKAGIKGIGGLTLGADPIADAVAYTSYLKNRPVEICGQEDRQSAWHHAVDRRKYRGRRQSCDC